MEKEKLQQLLATENEQLQMLCRREAVVTKAI